MRAEWPARRRRRAAGSCTRRRCRACSPRTWAAAAAAVAAVALARCACSVRTAPFRRTECVLTTSRLAHRTARVIWERAGSARMFVADGFVCSVVFARARIANVLFVSLSSSTKRSVHSRTGSYAKTCKCCSRSLYVLNVPRAVSVYVSWWHQHVLCPYVQKTPIAHHNRGQFMAAAAAVLPIWGKFEQITQRSCSAIAHHQRKACIDLLSGSITHVSAEPELLALIAHTGPGEIAGAARPAAASRVLAQAVEPVRSIITIRTHPSSCPQSSSSFQTACLRSQVQRPALIHAQAIFAQMYY